VVRKRGQVGWRADIRWARSWDGSSNDSNRGTEYTMEKMVRILRHLQIGLDGPNSSESSTNKDVIDF